MVLAVRVYLSATAFFRKADYLILDQSRYGYSGFSFQPTSLGGSDRRLFKLDSCQGARYYSCGCSLGFPTSNNCFLYFKAAIWSSVCTFSKFYQVEVAAHLMPVSGVMAFRRLFELQAVSSSLLSSWTC